MISFICGYIITTKIAKKMNWTTDELDSFFTYMILGTAIGARLGHCLFYDFEYYNHNILEIFLPIRITSSGVRFEGYNGLASHGAAIGILVSTYLFAKKNAKKWLECLDLIGVAVCLGGAMIRLGNFFNSEIVGKRTTSSLGVIFKYRFNDNVPRHPAQLYEACGYLLIGLISYLIFSQLFKKNIYKQKTGFITGFYVAMIFVLRFFIEYVKESQNDFDSHVLSALGINMGQLLSIPFIIVFSILMIWAILKKK